MDGEFSIMWMTYESEFGVEFVNLDRVHCTSIREGCVYFSWNNESDFTIKFEELTKARVVTAQEMVAILAISSRVKINEPT